MTTALAKKKRVQRRSTARPVAKWNLRRAGSLQILEAPALAKLKWLMHGFSTRVGGTSRLGESVRGEKAQEKILNLGFTDWDSRERVTENRKKFFCAVGASNCMAASQLLWKRNSLRSLKRSPRYWHGIARKRVC